LKQHQQKVADTHGKWRIKTTMERSFKGTIQVEKRRPMEGEFRIWNFYGHLLFSKVQAAKTRKKPFWAAN
jgi:hypothetical protein